MGWLYLLGALGGGAYLLTKSAQLALAPDRRSAMVNFHASLIQLTLLLVAAIADAALHA
jgi:protoheme IX farnesyltransferase